MKALKFLKHMKQTDTPYNFRDCELDEAIAELEKAMKPKTCDGCVYEEKDDGFLNVECAFCLRNSNDNFKPKDTQC